MPRRTPPRIRTGNLRNLNPTPLPIGLEGHLRCARGIFGDQTDADTRCGWRGSNPRSPRWQRDALPAAPHPRWPTPFGQLQLACPVRLTPPRCPCVGGGDPGLTVPRSARAADGHRQPWSLHRESNPGPRPYRGRARSAELRRRGVSESESPEPDSNRRPSAYRADALAELSYRGMERVRRRASRVDGVYGLLPRLDSNQDELIQNQSCCQLHHGAKKRCAFTVRRPAASPGFEPELGEPKSRVLPVTPRGMVVRGSRGSRTRTSVKTPGFEAGAAASYAREPKRTVTSTARFRWPARWRPSCIQRKTRPTDALA